MSGTPLTMRKMLDEEAQNLGESKRSPLESGREKH
jgi:hypothetical protein